MFYKLLENSLGSFMQNYIKFNELEKKDKNKNPPAIRNLLLLIAFPISVGRWEELPVL